MMRDDRLRQGERSKVTSFQCGLTQNAVLKNKARGAMKATGLADCWTQHVKVQGRQGKKK